MTTCESMTVPAPTRTPPPMTEYAPTRTPAPSCAPGSTRAAGSISGAARVATCRRRRASATRCSPQRPAPVEDGDLQAELVARHGRPPELGLVDADDVDLEPPRVRRVLQQPDA